MRPGQPRAADSCASAPVDPGERSRRMLSAQPMKPEQARLIQGHRVTKRRSHEDRVSVMGVVTRAYQDAVSLLHGNREASIRSDSRSGRRWRWNGCGTPPSAASG